MPRVEFVSQSAQDQDSIASNPARLLNLYPSPIADAENGRIWQFKRDKSRYTNINNSDN
jgi:hypothetical protein